MTAPAHSNHVVVRFTLEAALPAGATAADVDRLEADLERLGWRVPAVVGGLNHGPRQAAITTQRTVVEEPSEVTVQRWRGVARGARPEGGRL